MLAELIHRYETIGHEALDLEAGLGEPTEPYKETLDRLIEEARGKIEVKDLYTKEEAVGILGTIDGILLENFSINTDLNAYLLSQGLDKKVLDCDNASLIYLSIAEALKLPLSAVYTPHHVFVRFDADGNSLNWETTSGMELSDDYYRDRLNISDESVRNGVYLRNLTREETIAIVYDNRGNAWDDKGNPDNAIADYNSAIELDPNFAVAYYNRGNAKLRKLNLSGFFADIARAVYHRMVR